jgi:hypothetical protein
MVSRRSSVKIRRKHGESLSAPLVGSDIEDRGLLVTLVFEGKGERAIVE